MTQSTRLRPASASNSIKNSALAIGMTGHAGSGHAQLKAASRLGLLVSVGPFGGSQTLETTPNFQSNLSEFTTNDVCRSGIC